VERTLRESLIMTTARFGADGDGIFSDSTLTLGEAVQRACTAVKKDSPQ
jgi:hypothetical protein